MLISSHMDTIVNFPLQVPQRIRQGDLRINLYLSPNEVISSPFDQSARRLRVSRAFLFGQAGGKGRKHKKNA